MSAIRFSVTLAGAIAGFAGTACAGPSWGYPDAPGRLVSVRLEVEGSRTPSIPTLAAAAGSTSRPGRARATRSGSTTEPARGWGSW